MKKIVFILLFIPVSILAQVEFAPLGAKWYYNLEANGNILNSHLNTIIAESDTVINGVNCRILQQYRDNVATTANKRYIVKQEQGKVYYYYDKQFHLLFDFDVKEGDTLLFTFVYNKYSYDTMELVDTFLSARYIVTEITSNAQNLKNITTVLVEEDQIIDHQNSILLPVYSYTEKIGFNRDFMPILDNLVHPAVDNFQMLRCYSDDAISYISESWQAFHLPCNYSVVTTVSNPKDDTNISISPNPFADIIRIVLTEESMVKIVSFDGQEVLNTTLLAGHNELSLKDFPKGIYMIIIQEKTQTKYLKIIKI